MISHRSLEAKEKQVWSLVVVVVVVGGGGGGEGGCNVFYSLISCYKMNGKMLTKAKFLFYQRL